jgi:hypothetical protein
MTFERHDGGYIGYATALKLDAVEVIVMGSSVEDCAMAARRLAPVTFIDHTLIIRVLLSVPKS